MPSLTFYTTRTTEQRYPLRFTVDLLWVDVLPCRTIHFETCNPDALAMFHAGEYVTVDVDNLSFLRTLEDPDLRRMLNQSNDPPSICAQEPQ